MKEKIIGCSAAGSAIGAGIGAALSGSIGVPGSVFGAAVIAGAFAAAAAAACRGRREETLPAPPHAAEAPVKADRQALPAARMQRADVDFLSIAEEMAFASQQLIWGIDQYRAVIAQVEKLAAGISEESETNASNLEEASAGVEEIAASASKISDVATSSLAECKSSTEIAGRCQQVIAQASQDIQTVAGSVQQGVEEIDELNAASEKIQAFVGKIRGIAAQTNLLALNASIEAARAGEHGRGFAVVAGEVGKLANESDETTQEIEEIVREITTKTATVTERMRAGSEQLGAVEGQAQDSAAAMQGLSRNVSHLEQIVDELTQMSDSQRETTDQMARVVEHVGQATVSIAGNTQEATSSIQGQRRNLEEIHGYAKSLLHVADEVQRAAMQFKQPDEIVFAVNPFTAPETIKKTYVPILKDVAARAGKKARTIIVADYEALGEAHAHGLIHRDLKPDNILIAEDEHGILRPKLMDFGLALRADENDMRITCDGMVVGTPIYMAPEQACDEHYQICPATDFYGIGCILYELFCGVPPFSGANAVAVMVAQAKEPPRKFTPLPEFAEAIRLSNILDRLFEKMPDRNRRRFQSRTAPTNARPRRKHVRRAGTQNRKRHRARYRKSRR